ncbi:MAG: ABC transporter permease [Muricomes sp.]
MLKYIGKRMGLSVVSLFMLVTVAFFLTRLMPGSPFQSGNVSGNLLKSMEREYGLDKPLTEQYQTYLTNLLHGNLGISLKKPDVTVAEVINRAWPVTALLGGLAIVTAAVLGTLLGIWQAASRRKAVKGSIFLVTMLGTGIPNFVVGLLLMLFLGVKLKLFPVVGLTSPQSYILPVISLAVYPTSVITKLMQNTFHTEMEKDYVTMARAKGLGFKKTAFTQILKNAWIPVLNYLGPAAAFLLTGSFVVESIFTIPGLGREFVNSIGNRDYTLILGLTVFMGITVIGINLVTDLLAAWLNPRVRRSFQ